MGWKANYLAAHDDWVIGWTNPYGKRLGNPTSLGPMCSWDYQLDLPGGSPDSCRGQLIREIPGHKITIYICASFAACFFSPLEKWVTFLLNPWNWFSGSVWFSKDSPSIQSILEFNTKKSPSYHFLWWRAGIESLRIAFRNHLPFMTTKTKEDLWHGEMHEDVTFTYVSSIAAFLMRFAHIYVVVMSQMIRVLQRKEEATMCSAHKVWGTVILRNTQDASYVSKCDQSDHQQSTIKNSQLIAMKQSLNSIGYVLQIYPLETTWLRTIFCPSW